VNRHASGTELTHELFQGYKEVCFELPNGICRSVPMDRMVFNEMTKAATGEGQGGIRLPASLNSMVLQGES
jgi:hypothetical protein